MSGFYNIGKEELLARTIPDTAGVWIVGVNDEYVFNAGHTAWELLEPYVILPEKQLTNVTFTDGILNSDEPQWIAAGAGAAPEDNLNLLGVIIYFKQDDVGTLFAFMDRATVGLPQTLKGVNVTARKANSIGWLKL